MSYVLYIGEDCHDCVMVADYVKEKNLSGKIEVSNVDTEEANPPMEVYARLALFVDGDIKAYGVDIIDYIEANVLSK